MPACGVRATARLLSKTGHADNSRGTVRYYRAMYRAPNGNKKKILHKNKRKITSKKTKYITQDVKRQRERQAERQKKCVAVCLCFMLLIVYCNPQRVKILTKHARGIASDENKSIDRITYEDTYLFIFLAGGGGMP